jgi:two-component system nitrogen regulation sensor histidine kinase GlnL
MELSGHEQLTEYTDVMVREVERVNSIIEELMDLTRPRQATFAEVNLTRILNDIVLFQKESQRGKAIEFILHLDPSIPPIRGDGNLLTRLFLNLVKNAAEAIEGAGRVEISTRVATEFHMHKPGARPVPMIRVEIRDTGKGIPTAELEHIFTPFYTTKDYGSGLGLATCQKIVNEHDGLIKVESSVGSGSLFSVSLPFLR